jgi:sortase A
MTKSRIRGRSKTRWWIETCLLLVGMVALGVWTWSIARTAIFQDWDNWVFDREVRSEPVTIAEYLEEKRAGIVGDVRSWLRIPASPSPANPKRSMPHSVTTLPAHRLPILKSNSVVGRLAIPRLHLSAIVREGTGENTLDLALGHIPGTAVPGQNGNAGVAGHRDTIFRGLGKIHKNDLILFETLAGNYAYRVETTEIVRPKDVSVLRDRRHPELTLVTCYPFYYIGSAPDRFIVSARQVSQMPLDRKLSEESATQLNRPAAVSQEPAEDGGEPRPPGPNRMDRTAPGGGAPKPGVKRVTFEVSVGHSRQLVPGISVGFTGTNVTHHRADGWMWVVPDHRTIWLRNLSAYEPVIFYGHQDGKKRELMMTSVTEKWVTGYLLLPEDRTNAASLESFQDSIR